MCVIRETKVATLNLRLEFREWLGSRQWLNATAFTGHLFPSVAENNRGTAEKRFFSAARHNRFFCALVDRAVYGSASKKRRGMKRVPRVLVVEEGAIRTHVHACFAFPLWVGQAEASEILATAWTSAPFGLPDVRCAPVTDVRTFFNGDVETWGAYMLKQVRANGLGIDLDCLVLPAADIN